MSNEQQQAVMPPILDAYDWEEVFGYANGKKATPDGGDPFDRSDVAEIYALHYGDNDATDWMAFGRLRRGDYFKVQAGCDYTGWG